MKNIVITGTSGVGKTFLEQELESLGLTFQLPKYTNCPSRPGENSAKTVCLPPAEFASFDTSNSFFFTLDYSGFRYGWKRSDLLLHPGLSVTLAITLDSLADFLSQNSDFLPILLAIDGSSLSLIEKRLYSRENFSSLTPDKQIEVKSKIDHRLDLARQEIKQISSYQELVTSHHGLIFSTTDDRTIFSEAIPSIQALLTNSSS
jgi:guanylate kinase